jgi:hypothetical protein
MCIARIVNSFKLMGKLRKAFRVIDDHLSDLGASFSGQLDLARNSCFFSRLSPVLVAVVIRRARWLTSASAIRPDSNSHLSQRANDILDINLTSPGGIASYRLALNHEHLHDRRLPTESLRTGCRGPPLGGGIGQIRIRPRDSIDSECCH